jgi:hypothetical protein
LALGVYPVAAQSDGIELIVDRSPAEGGAVTPEVGTHRFTAHSDVTITATAQQGYKFAYWIGDVQDPTSSTTRIRMGSAKSVVAVFEQDENEGWTRQEEDLIVRTGGGGGGGGGGLVATATDLWAGSSISVTGGERVVSQTIVWDIPHAAVPEPTTLTLLGLGTAFLTRIRARRQSGRS